MEALYEYLEDYFDARDAEEAYAEWIASGKKSFSWEQVKKECGLE